MLAAHKSEGGGLAENVDLVRGAYEFHAQAAHIWDFENRKVVRLQQYTDTWQFAEVTAVTPALAAGS